MVAGGLVTSKILEGYRHKWQGTGEWEAAERDM